MKFGEQKKKLIFKLLHFDGHIGLQLSPLRKD